VQRGPAGTFSYVIGAGDIASARPVTVIQQNETEAVIASGLSPSERVVTTGFANLADGSRVIIGRDDQTPQADLAPRKRGGRNSQAKDSQAKDGQPSGERGQGKREWQGKDGARRQHPAADANASEQGGQGTGTGQGGDQSGSGARPQP
jgi:multidrug efflux system membrane fusion protein